MGINTIAEASNTLVAIVGKAGRATFTVANTLDNASVAANKNGKKKKLPTNIVCWVDMDMQQYKTTMIKYNAIAL